MIDYKSLIQKLLMKYKCPKGVDFFPKTVGETGQGFIYRKGYPHRKIISNTIREVSQTQEILRLRKIWDLDSNVLCQNKPTAVMQFEWQYFTGMMVTVGIMTYVGIVVNIGKHVFVYIYGENPLIKETHKHSEERKERQKDR